jgi:hypothetical protein
MPSRKRRPPATRRSALELLAASPDGCTEAILIGLAPAGTNAGLTIRDFKWLMHVIVKWPREAGDPPLD